MSLLTRCKVQCFPLSTNLSAQDLFDQLVSHHKILISQKWNFSWQLLVLTKLLLERSRCFRMRRKVGREMYSKYMRASSNPEYTIVRCLRSLVQAFALSSYFLTINNAEKKLPHMFLTLRLMTVLRTQTPFLKENIEKASVEQNQIPKPQKYLYSSQPYL